jgi:AraC family ethanolamine operon transcriptional activator
MPKVRAHTQQSDVPERILLNRSFRDVEELIVCAKEWDLDFTQLEPGEFEGKLTQVIAPQWHLGHAQFGRSLKQEGLPPRHLRNIVIPATPDQEFHWRGHQITGNRVMVFPHGGELASISASGFEVYILALREETVDQVCSDLGLRSLAALTGGAEVMACEARAVHRLRHRMGQLMQHIRGAPEVIHQASFSAAAEVDLCTQVLSALAQGRAASRINRSRRQRYVLETAEAYMRAHACEGCSIDDLCRRLSISERTLRAAFQQHYGISPKAFLKCHRLTQVRRHLGRAAGSTARIQDVAHAWGFWHMGQFARDYRAMFAELPSDTLTRLRSPCR